MSREICTTKEYGRFLINSFNRKVENIRRLESSMRKYGWINAYPMFVVKNDDNKFYIKDGHHRFIVAKSLGLLIKYVVCDEDISIYELQKTTKKWSLRDYLNAYVQEGYQSYIIVKDFVDETKMPLGSAISLLSGESAGSGNKTPAFMNGNFRLLSNNRNAEIVKAIVLLMRELNIKIYNNCYFIQAISKILFVDEFDYKLFIKKIKAFPSLLVKQPNLSGYLDMIESVYNRQSHKRVDLSFLANEKARERQRKFGRGYK